MAENSGQVKNRRKTIRTLFTKTADKLEAELNKPEKEVTTIETLMEILQDKQERLEEMQNKLQSLYVEEELAEGDVSMDLTEALEKYHDRYIALRLRVKKLFPQTSPNTNTGTESLKSESSSQYEKRKYRLPILELPKFSGEVRDWLPWWSQFKNIHDKEDIAPEQKFQYLIQCMVIGSRAMTLVKSFPATPTNYPKVIHQLEDRFGRKDLLIQVYVRDLLGMVVERATTKGKTNLTELYDRLETQLRSLESLEGTKPESAGFLIPLVESCLPEDVLRLWERERSKDNGATDSAAMLEKLMAFLKQEVNSEEMYCLARKGLGTEKPVEIKSNQTKKKSEAATTKKQPTVTTLMNAEKTAPPVSQILCVFCEKSHPSSECHMALSKSLEDRTELLKSKKACLVCLRVGHFGRNCKCHIKCQFCTKQHYTLMCPALETKRKAKSDPEENKSVGTDLSNYGFSENEVDARSDVWLQTLVVKVAHNNKEYQARALFDNGSQRSYVSQRLICHLGIKKKSQEIVRHLMLGGLETEPQVESIYPLEVFNIDRSYSFKMEARAKKTVCGPIPLWPVQSLGQELLQELGLTNARRTSMDIDLLIGADYYGQQLTGCIKALPSGLTAIETKLGWTISGPKDDVALSGKNLVHLVLHDLTNSITKLWKLDVLGIEEPLKILTDQEHQQKLLKQFQENIEVTPEGRYRVALPWRETCPSLPENKELTHKRMERVKSSLQKKGLTDDYKKVFDLWLEQDIIEEVPSSEIKNFGHYLPHRPVIKESSQTTKIRPVFDASAHGKGEPSLNDCLEKGPNLIEMIPDILDRFRMEPIAVISDIEKAFLQIEVLPEHRDYLRFFDCNNDKIFRHKRVVFGVTSSPFLLAAVLNHHLENVQPELQNTASQLKKSFYVDNCVTSVRDEDQLYKFIEESQVMMKNACMNLRGWEHNAPSQKSIENRDIDVIGLKWNLQSDLMKCNLTHLLEDKSPMTTKRLILSITQRLFDPIGATCPVTIQPKMMLQELWLLKKGWDEPLQEDWQKRFEDWHKHLPCLEEVTVPRHLGITEDSSLHVFVDASQNAYAACIFVRTEKRENTHICLVRAKARIAPASQVSIPRLELMACCIGARLLASFKQATKLNEIKTYFWTDSTTAFWWITKDGPWKVFVSNRVKEIRQLTDPSQWRHVPGKMNPADLLSRGCNAKMLLESQWWNGPDWLKGRPDSWPVLQELSPTDEMQMEQKITSLLVESCPEPESLLKFQNIQDYGLILRIIARLRRFCNNARSGKEHRNIGNLTCTEVDSAEVVFLKMIQREMGEQRKRIHHATLFQDDQGLWRIKSAVFDRKDCDSFRSPIVLTGEHPMVQKLLRHVHVQKCHPGTQIMLGIIRENYWIQGGRRAIRKVIHHCVKCQRHNARPFETLPIQLPEDRVNDAAAFEVSGIDMLGPFILSDGAKTWVALFTCAVFRAIHLELVSSISTETLIQAIRRFISRRSRPRVIYSDQGSNFTGCAKALKDVDWNKVEFFAVAQRIQWKLTPPKAAWWGGWWERLVQIIKNLTKRTLGRASLNFEELQTVLCDCEATINSRPLTYINEDPSALVPLTPAMFLHEEKRNLEVVDFDQIDNKSLNKRVRYRTRLSTELRKRFRNEYLGQLVTTWRRGRTTRPVKLGEIVLLGDANVKRVNWMLGKVEHLYCGRDGQVRRVKVKTQNNVLERPVQTIYPMEIAADDPLTVNAAELLDSGETCSDPIANHPLRIGPSAEVKEKDVEKYYKTKAGRIIKCPKYQNLFDTIEDDSLETRPNVAKRGGC